jgi:endogenous inhibitor of DNA gyrase (YacG/DUF329 family)
MTESKCPACGANVAYRTSISLYSVCPFCRSLVQRKDLDLKALGKVAQLQSDGTPLQVGAKGAYRGAAFELVGRVQLKMPVGFWNEWAMIFADGRQGWLGEAQGVYVVTFNVEEKVPGYAKLDLGDPVPIKGTAFHVRERVKAHYVSAEGELPFKPPLGLSDAAPSVDLTAAGGRFATIDYSDSPPTVFAGEYQDYGALALTGVKSFEGWT